MYWSTSEVLRMPLYPSIMPRNRFSDIQSARSRPYNEAVHAILFAEKITLVCFGSSREKRSFGSTPAKTAWEAQEVTAGSTWIGKYIVRYINVEIKSFFSFSKKEFAPKSALKVCFESYTFLIRPQYFKCSRLFCKRYTYTVFIFSHVGVFATVPYQQSFCRGSLYIRFSHFKTARFCVFSECIAILCDVT